MHPASKKANSVSLTVAQKEHIIKNVGKGTRVDLYQGMRDDPNIDVSNSQINDVTKFKKAISQFLCNPSTKEKYFQHYWLRDTMTKEQVQEVLEALKTPF